ncbi:MAG: hypothetical protein HQ475_07100 [SAR202 cluster bacterium]|nr:hypothetical protein [SAR202 cluster bacterium]
MNARILPTIRWPYTGQRGITGLETAIVLIAFVVVSSVFAFATLSVGMFASDKSREVHMVGLENTRTSLELKGSIIGKANAFGVTGVLTELKFNVSQAAGGFEVDLTPGTLIIKYTDKRQSKVFGSSSGIKVAGIGGSDSDNLLERNETYEVRMVNLDVTGSGDNSLTYPVGVNETFTLEVIPTEGSVLMLERTTPIYMDQFNFLN